MIKQILNSKESMIFYLSVAALTGLLLGWFKLNAEYYPFFTRIVLWIFHFEVFWLVGLLALKIIDLMISRFTKNIGIHLFLAAIMTVLMARPIYLAVNALKPNVLYGGATAVEEIEISPMAFDFSLEFLVYMAQNYIHALIIWIPTILVINAYGTLPLNLSFGKNKAPRTGDDHIHVDKLVGKYSDKKEGKIPFLKRMKHDLGTELLFLKAEGHYVRVMTTLGEEMVYYRFGEATAQMVDWGVQVHRSYWISNLLLSDTRTTFSDTYISTEMGEKIPVGLTFRRELKRRFEDRICSKDI